MLTSRPKIECGYFQWVGLKLKIFAAAESDARSHKTGHPFNLPLAVL